MMKDIEEKSTEDAACSFNSPVEACAAKKRWKFLAKSITQPRINRANYRHEFQSSGRQFGGFDLVMYDKNVEDDMGIWFQIADRNSKTSVQIRLLYAKVDPKILIGFNNTGNVCVWPAEEIMSYYCQKRQDVFRGKRICEIGGGMTALAGLMLAVSVKAEKVHLTDGNQASVAILESNRSKITAKNVTAGQLIWERNHISKESITNDTAYDYIICADCLFFTESHEDLIDTIWRLLKDEGTALLFAPNRGETLSLFVALAKSSFDVTITENYDDDVWEKHQVYKSSQSFYDENIHYPFLITMRKEIETMEI